MKPLLVQLPNGLKIFGLNQIELGFLYREIFERKVYFKHGITLQQGHCVFDVGANVGLFSLLVTDQVKDLNLYAFEPIPEIFQVLQLNQAAHFPKAQLLNCGLSQVAKTATLIYYPNCSGWSTLYPDEQQVRESLYAYAKHSKQGLLTTTLAKILPGVHRSIFDQIANRLFGGRQPVSCPLQTLSQVIAEQRVSQIDLLKIDVEGSELDVLLGIQTADWPKIRQIVLEVQAGHNRLERIVSLLSAQGFQVRVEQEPELRNTGYYQIYARRSPSEAGI